MRFILTFVSIYLLFNHVWTNDLSDHVDANRSDINKLYDMVLEMEDVK